jgi:type II secretory pathway component PulF
VLSHIVLILLGVAALVAASSAYVRTAAGRYQVDRLKLSLPFFGIVLRKYSISRVFRTLGIMLKGGVPITTALPITAAVSANRVLENAVRRAHERIIKGQDFSSSLAEEKDFPRLIIRMVAVGEAAGQLPEVMEKAADGYEDQVEGSIMVATSLFEPVVICVFGAVVLILVLAIYLPIFSMARTMQ